MRHIPRHARNDRRCPYERGLQLTFLTWNNIQNRHFQYHLRVSLLNACRNSTANCFAFSTGVSLSPIIFTHAEPTMTPSASAPTSFACSRVPIPNPTHTGADVCSRTRVINSLSPSEMDERAPVTPVTETR